MNEKVISELIDYILHTPDAVTIQARMQECFEGLAWAEQEQQWDLAINLATTLSSHFTYSRAADLGIENQDVEQIATTMRSFWEQGRDCARRGLIAARLAGQDEGSFLGCLAQLSSYLEEFRIALTYLKQLLSLVPPDRRWLILREIHFLGVQAMEKREFSIARDCYQTRLDEWEKMGGLQSMADTLAWMAVNEERQGNISAAKQLLDKSNQLRNQLKEDNQ